MNNIKFLLETLFSVSGRKYSASYLKEKLSFDTGDNAFTLEQQLAAYGIIAENYGIKDLEILEKFIKAKTHSNAPVIANTSKGWVLITEYHYQQSSGDMVVNYIAQGIHEEVPLVTFFQIYLGVVFSLNLEKFSDPAGKEYLEQDKQNKAIYVLKMATLAAAFACLAFLHHNAYQTILTVLSLCGVYVSYMLIAQEFGVLPDLIANICSPKKHIQEDVEKNSKQGKESVLSCKAVSESKQSKFTIKGVTIRLSDLSYVFFVFQSLILLASYGNREMLMLAMGMQVLVIPIPVLSIALQAKMNKFCTLCLIVSGILLLGILTSSLYISLVLEGNIFLPEAFYFLLAGLFTLVATLSVIFLRKTFREEMAAKTSKRRYALLLSKKETLEGHQLQMREIPQNLAYSIGNIYRPGLIRSKENHLDMLFITNPFCLPCARIHKEVKSVKEANTAYLMTYFDEIGMMICTQLIALSLLDYSLFPDALSKWYRGLEQKEINTSSMEHSLEYLRKITGIAAYPEETLVKATRILKDHQIWINSYGMEGTPTIFVNNKEMHASMFSVIPYVIDFFPKKESLLI